MAYKRKTKDLFVIQQDYGYGDGWEDVDAHEKYIDASKAITLLRQNQQGVPARIKNKREPINQPAANEEGRD